MSLFEKLINFPFNINSRTNLIINEFQLNKTNKYVWGMKRSGKRLRDKKNSFKYSRIVYLEDGFIHSYGEKKTKIPLSICKDNNGIYYDFRSKSDLFRLIKKKLSEQETLRSKIIISLWKKYGISKYNFSNSIKPPKNDFVLLVDQTLGDLSISYGGANNRTFQKMFDFARKKWPNLMIVIKIHPEVISKRKKGCINKKLYYEKNVKVIFERGQVNELLESCTALCVVTSQVGFEGLIYNKEVHVFGNPFYSGLGLTIDHSLLKERKKKFEVSLEQLVYNALVRYQTYLDPRNKKICQIEKIIEYLKEKRKINNFFPNNLHCLNLTPWKARQIYRYTKDLDDIKVSSFKKFSEGMKNVLVWGKSIKSDKFFPKTHSFISVEDGFIRSVGLGGDLISPLSLVFDKKGIHYDFSKPSDLEGLLERKVVNDEEIERSKKLIKLIRLKNISKYNLNTERKFLYKNKSQQNKILVLGQVETDSSMIYGVPKDTIKKTNYSLVCQVRKHYPNDYIIYKPHPDLENKLRSKGQEEDLIQNVADAIAYKVAIQELFEISDRVAVFTSLGGFEAILRNIPVICYGLPFYSGWGLTDDKYINIELKKRRTRKLTLEELVYISIVEYPYYFSLKYNCITEIENIINEMDLYRNDKKNLEQIIFRYWGALKDFIKQRGIF